MAPKTRTTRTVDLLEPVADDLLRVDGARPQRSVPCCRAATAAPGPRTTGATGRRRVYQPAATAAGGSPATCVRTALRGSFVSLLLWEGRSVTYVAAQAGHSLLTL
jgi:hypothetical protein